MSHTLENESLGRLGRLWIIWKVPRPWHHLDLMHTYTYICNLSYILVWSVGNNRKKQKKLTSVLLSVGLAWPQCIWKTEILQCSSTVNYFVIVKFWATKGWAVWIPSSKQSYNSLLLGPFENTFSAKSLLNTLK